MAKIIILPTAANDLDNIESTYSEAPIRYKEIGVNIQKGMQTLSVFPKAGVVLSLQEDSIYDYRSFVTDFQYKLVYYIDEDIVWIVAIWDCRQDPNKLSDKLK